MSKNVSDFAVLDRIADECGENGIVMLPTILRVKLVKAGGEITFGVPAKAMEWLLNETHHFVLYGINKEDFMRIKSELREE